VQRDNSDNLHPYLGAEIREQKGILVLSHVIPPFETPCVVEKMGMSLTSGNRRSEAFLKLCRLKSNSAIFHAGVGPLFLFTSSLRCFVNVAPRKPEVIAQRPPETSTCLEKCHKQLSYPRWGSHFGLLDVHSEHDA
jgi:hypothetical protein